MRPCITVLPQDELKLENGKCPQFYFHHLPRDFGLMHLRLQSGFPFQVQICSNGRQGLSRPMDRHQMDYAQKENCFTWISPLKGAQRLMDKPLDLDWPEQLDRILRQNHPPGFGDLPAFGIELLLDNPGERIRNGCAVQKSQAIDAHLSGAGASRHHQFFQCGRHAFLGPSRGGAWKRTGQL